MLNLIPYFWGSENKVSMNFFLSKFKLKDFNECNEQLVYCLLSYCKSIGVPLKDNSILSYKKSQLQADIKKYNIKTKDNLGADYGDPGMLQEATQSLVLIFELVIDQVKKKMDEMEEGKSSFQLELSNWLSIRLREEVSKYNLEIHNLTLDEYLGNSLQDEIADRVAKIKACYTKYSQAIVEEYSKKLLGKRVTAGTDEENLRRVIYKLEKFGEYGDDILRFLSGTMNVIVGAPGTGKSRFVLGEIISKAIQDGISVRFENMEQDTPAVKAMIKSNYLATTTGVIIPDSRMAEEGGMDSMETGLAKAADYKLFGDDSTMGELFLVDSAEEFVRVEDLVDTMTTFFKLNPHVKIWAIDYVGMFPSNDPKKDKSKRIEEAIEAIHTIKREITDLTIIVITQYGKDGIIHANRELPYDAGDLEGGQVTDRYADKIIRMTTNSAQRASGTFLGMECVKNRQGRVGRFTLRSNKAVSNFELHRE